MAEPDVFERRLRAALDRHVAGGPTGFDALGFARTIAAREPRRNGLGAVLGWRRVVPPRAAWALLLVALLAVLGAGTLYVGSHLSREAPAVVPPITSAFACPPGSTPDEPGPANQARPPGAGPMAFDRAAGKIVMLASGETWTFDVCSNTWTLMQRGSGPDTGLALVYDPGTDLVIGVDYPEHPYPEHPVVSPPHAWTYSVADNTWTRKGTAPEYVARLWYDASSARVAAWAAASDDAPGTIWTYDVASDEWAAVGALEVLGGYGWNTPGDLLAYDASLDRVVVTDPGGDRTRLFDMHTGSVADVKAIGPWAGRCGWMSLMFCYDGVAGAAIAYEERTEQTVVRIGDHLFAYDAAADRWETLFEPGVPDMSDAVALANAAASALVRESWSMVSDPLNGRLIVPSDAGGALLAFDATTRQWTVLLEPSERSPAPNSE